VPIAVEEKKKGQATMVSSYAVVAGNDGDGKLYQFVFVVTFQKVEKRKKRGNCWQAVLTCLFLLHSECGVGGGKERGG